MFYWSIYHIITWIHVFQINCFCLYDIVVVVVFNYKLPVYNASNLTYNSLKLWVGIHCSKANKLMKIVCTLNMLYPILNTI